MSTSDETETQYSWVFQHSPVALFVEEYASYLAQLDAIRRSGVTDLRAYLQRHPEALVALSQSIRVIDVNLAALAMFGAQSKEELLGSITKIFLPESFPVFCDWAVALFQGAHEHRAETVVGTLRGERIYVMITITLLPLLTHGAGRRTLVSCTDISNRKRAEDALRASREKYAELYENAPDMIASLRQTGGEIADCNQTMAAMLGYRKEELCGRSVLELVSPEGRGGVEEAIHMLESTGTVSMPYVKLLCKSGAVLDTSLNISVVRDEAGQFICHNAVWRDITAQKRAEDALAANEKLYRTLIESIPHPIWMGDASGCITYYNRAMAEITGMPYEEAALRDWVEWVHEEDREKIISIRKAAQEHGNAYSGECRFRTTGGLFRNMYFIDTPVKDNDHGIRQWVGIDIDITELKKAHDELQRALDRSNDELAQFAYAASHDLQEPLRMVTSYTQLLRQRYADQLDERANKYISYAVEGSKRIRKLILDVLALSNVNMHGKPFRLLECGDIVDEVTDLMREDLQKANARISHERLPTLRADPGQLRELFHCLFSNSIKFRGDENPHVHISARRTGASWLFTVEDNGKGFDSSAYGERVFQMFQRLHTRDQYPGTGIGLTMAKKIVERHGGRIWVESQPGQGARFFIILPAADLEEITMM